ncbi:hypothetical protein ABS71_12475 [bacterium SCN 62-11]|nr:MAG: hypothetical protein ABS71_12475 [bacterium SCN 62-11]
METLSILFWTGLIAGLEIYFPPALLFRPATGACTAVVILKGRRAWPIPFLAILIASQWLGYSSSQAGLQACCDSLQALLAEHFVQRQLGFPNPLSRTRELIRFHLLIGPLASLAGSLVKLLGFFALSLPLAYPPVAFFAMDWLGQVLGATLTTASLLSLSAPGPTWKRRRAAVAIPTLVLILVSLWGRRQVQKQVDRLEQVDLRREARTLANDLQTRLDECCTLLYGLAAAPGAQPSLEALRIPENLPRLRLLLRRRSPEGWQSSGDRTLLPSALATLNDLQPETEPLITATSPQSILVAIPALPSGSQLAGVFTSRSILETALTASRRHPDTRFRVLFGEKLLLEQPAARPLHAPLIHEGEQLPAGFRIEASRRFDTNQPRIGLPIAFTIYSVLLFYLLRMSNQADQLQQALLDARKAEQAKNLFLGNMSHEIRTPMNGILGLTRLVLQSGLAPAQAEQLRHAERSGQALLSLLNDLLEVSKMEAGELQLHPAPTSLEALLEQSVRSHSLTAQEKDLEVLVTIGMNVPDQVILDGNRLSQILNNLLGNAIKFTSVGQIELMVELTHWAEHQACLHFEVRDTGVGIPDDRLDSIFAPFVQTNTTFSSENSGAGLGLAIASHLVERLGGKLEVRSQLGEGSTFSFSLLCPAQSVPAELLPACITPASVSCWVALSHQGLSKALRAQLGLWGFCLAGRAAEAQLVLADEHSLGRQQNPAVATVVLLPLVGLGAHFQRCHERGAVPLLRPVFPGALREALSQALNPSRAQAVVSPNPCQLTPDYVGMRALVADDHATNRFLAQLMLERMGFSVDCVEDGEKAVAACELASFDLILMDLRMPRLDGYGATKAIRAAGSLTPILASTAHSGAELERQPMESGMNGVLHKPVSQEQLHHAVASLLASPAEISSLRQSLLLSVGGDSRSARAVAETFLEEISQPGRPPDQLHRLKGSLEIFGDSPLLQLCQHPETVSIRELQTAVARLALVVRAFLREEGGA